MNTDPDPDPRDLAPSEEHSDSRYLQVTPAIGRIGRYTLLRKLGQGGMGMVYLAEQTEPVQRQVAVKLVRADIEDRLVLARFETERQTLALMTHPGIARVFDAGTSEDGRSYFVMEYFPGTPVTVYCNEHRLTLRERLDLFLEVCQAVQHAHEKAIIHRDLKPSNILVAEQDGRARVKVIDFGIARALEGRSDESLTAHDAILGSPAYISPEQLHQGSKCADVRSDVFSLGVILYELLVGSSPFRRAGGQSLSTLLNVLILEPAPPSQAISAGADAAGHAARLSTTASELCRRLRGDLDQIVLKALAKEPEHRYASARELAADIQRHFDHRPVTAAHPGTAYRLKKFVRRHRVGVLVAGLTVVALLVAIAGLSIGLRQARQAEAAARRAEAKARQEADKAKAINEFLERMMAAANPWAQGKEVKVREVLDAAAGEIDSKLGGQPEVAASVRLTLGRTYMMLGLLKEGEAQLRPALDQHRKLLGERHPKTIENSGELVFCLTKLGRDEEAAALGRQALETARASLGPDHLLTLRIVGWLAIAYHRQEKYSQAESLYRQRVAAGERQTGLAKTEALNSQHNLVWLLINQQRFLEAEPIARRVLELSTQLNGRDYPLTLLARRHHVFLLAEKEDHTADAEYQALIDDHRRLLGPLHPDTISIRSIYAGFLLSDKRYPEAETLIREVLENRRRLFGDRSLSVFLSTRDLGEVLRMTGRPAEASALLTPALERFGRIIPENHPALIRCRILLALSICDLGRPAEADTRLRQILAQLRPSSPGVDVLLPALAARGETLLRLGRREQAEAVWQEAFAIGERHRYGPNKAAVALARLAGRKPPLPGAADILGRLQPTVSDHKP